MATREENISLERRRVVDRAVGEAIGGAPAIGALRASGGSGEAGEASQGFYNDDDDWVTWWKAGMPVGLAPVKPARF